MMNRLLSTVLILWAFVSLNCYSQSTSTLFENDSIIVKSSLERCNKPSKGTDINYVYLSIENKTNVSIAVDYHISKWYGSVCYGCDNSAELNYQITLEANQTLEGSCESSNKALRIYHSMNNGMSDKKLTNYQLEILTINTIGNE